MDFIRVARTHPAANLPTRKHPEDAGLDLFALEAATIGPCDLGVLRTGVTVEIPPGIVGLLKPKGRNDHLVGAGVIDAGYQGEILIKLFNPLDRVLEIQPGQAIAQMLLIPILTPTVRETSVEDLHAQATARGATGGIHGDD